MITVYVLQSVRSGRRYVGMTNDLLRRLREHRSGNTYARQIGEFVVVHTEQYATHAQARIREKFLKSGQGRIWLAQTYPCPGSASGG